MGQSLSWTANIRSHSRGIPRFYIPQYSLSCT